MGGQHLDIIQPPALGDDPTRRRSGRRLRHTLKRSRSLSADNCYTQLASGEEERRGGPEWWQNLRNRTVGDFDAERRGGPEWWQTFRSRTVSGFEDAFRRRAPPSSAIVHSQPPMVSLWDWIDSDLQIKDEYHQLAAGDEQNEDVAVVRSRWGRSRSRSKSAAGEGEDTRAETAPAERPARDRRMPSWRAWAAGRSPQDQYHSLADDDDNRSRYRPGATNHKEQYQGLPVDPAGEDGLDEVPGHTAAKHTNSSLRRRARSEAPRRSRHEW